MKKLLIFKIDAQTEEPIDKSCRPWLKDMKRTVGIDQSIVKYINYKYKGIIKVDYKNPYSVNLNDYDAIYQGTEYWALSHILREKGKNEHNKHINLLKKNYNFIQPYNYIKFGFNKCELYKQLSKLGIKMAPTRCISAKPGTKHLSIVKKFQSNHGRLFMKPIPGEQTTNVYNTKNNIVTKNKLYDYMKNIKNRDYDQIVIQKFMPQFATKRYPEIRTYWVGSKFQYAIHTTTAGYYQKTTYRISNHIRYATLKIIEYIERRFKFKFVFISYFKRVKINFIDFF